MKVISKALIATLKKDPIGTLNKLSEQDIAFIVQKANYQYYNSETPLFSDQLYDVIKEHLETINPNNPILKATGAAVGDDQRKETLPYFLGSLEKVKTDDKSLTKWVSSHPGPCVISDKLDGNSALLIWRSGNIKLFSRGDGTVGQNISHLIPFIQHVPKYTQSEELAVRGELIISKTDFETVKTKGANARNMVAGLINAKLPDLSLVGFMQFVAYEIISPIYTPREQYVKLKELGFKPAYNILIPSLSLDNMSKILQERRDQSEFEVDGIVVAHDKIYKRTKENPTYAFAFKSVHTMQKAEVTVTHVEWNMSKDGYMVPVVVFPDVQLAGVVIKRAHGFNAKYIKDNVIGPGSRIIIMRSGDVIPYIVEVLSKSETGAPQMPEVEYEWTKSHVDIVIPNKIKEESDEYKYKNLEYFLNKIDVQGLGPGNIKKMYNSGLTSVKNVFAATKTDLLKVDGFKDKTADKILSAIANAKDKLTCSKIMDASNVLGRGIGQKKIDMILEVYPSIAKERYVPTQQELVSIKGIEYNTAELFIDNLPKFFKFLDENELKCTDDPETAALSTHLDFIGQKIVFTGFRNAELENYIKSRGGDITGSVSKNTTLVVKKDKDSSKTKKAEELGIKVIELADFAAQYKIPL